MEAITGTDATFLYVESSRSPMHIGSVAVIEGSMPFDAFRDIMRTRLHLIPKLRQRLISVPLSIDYPYWVDDPNFELDLHLHHVALPEPGGWRELRSLASQTFSTPLDRSRPLWSFTFVEGLNNIPQVPAGSVAIISKVHHVAIDGVAGADILSLLFDPTPEPAEIAPERSYNPKPLPNDLTLMAKSSLSFVKKPLKLPRLLSDAAAATVKTGFLTRVQHVDMPAVPFSAPSTPLNGIISAQRKWNTAILSLDRIKNLKNLMGTTVNDVMLAICAGALRRYLLEKGQLPNKSLVGMVPISVRAQGDGASGNHLSMMLVQLATQIEDPIARLEAINENAMRGKTYQGALGAKTLSHMAEVIPFGVANQAARLYSRYKVAEMHSPVFNVVITNVPGPQLPLYLNGHKLLALMGMAPVIDGMGLIITILSYNGLVTISPTADTNSMPDIDLFTRYLRESANELEAAVLAQVEQEQQQGHSAEDDDAISQLFDRFAQRLADDGVDLDGIYNLQLDDEEAGTWQIDLNAEPATVSRGGASEADATISARSDHLLRIAGGDLDTTTAQVQGRLKITGDTTRAARLLNLLPQPQL